MESICNLGQNGIWLYLLITLISTIIGAFGAIMVDSKNQCRNQIFKPTGFKGMERKIYFSFHCFSLHTFGFVFNQ